MKEYTPLEVESIVQDTLSESLEEVLRSGARKMLCAALRYEVDEYIARFAHKVDEQESSCGGQKWVSSRQTSHHRHW